MQIHLNSVVDLLAKSFIIYNALLILVSLKTHLNNIMLDYLAFCLGGGAVG